MVQEKRDKGYSTIGDAPTGNLAVVPVSREAREPGFHPQPPDPIGSDDAEKLIGDLKTQATKQARLMPFLRSKTPILSAWTRLDGKRKTKPLAF